MKRFGLLLYLALVIWLIWPSLRKQFAPRSKVPATAPAFYPWSESSATVRIPKSLFVDHLRGLRVTNRDNLEFEVPEDFIAWLQLSPKEARRLGEAWAEALRSYGLAKRNHWNEISAPVTNRVVIEAYGYALSPFPNEIASIRKRLERQIFLALGKDRSDLFWRTTGSLVSDLFREGETSSPGQVKVTGALVDLQPGLSIELNGRPLPASRNQAQRD